MGNCFWRRNIDTDRASDPFHNSETTVDIKAGLCNADPITKHGKRIQTAQVLGIPLIPVAVLIIQTILSLDTNVKTKNDEDQKLMVAIKNRQLENLVDILDTERSVGCDYFLANYGVTAYQALGTACNATDAWLSAANGDSWPDMSILNLTASNSYNSQSLFVAALTTVRLRLRTANISQVEYLSFYSGTVDILMASTSSTIQISNHGIVWMKILSYLSLIHATDQYGLVYSLGRICYERGSLDSASYTLFVNSYTLARSYLFDVSHL